MKRTITDLEQKLINDGWQLVLKRYQGKHSEKTLCYEYHKTSDLRNNNKTYEQVIKLDKKRSQIVQYGINNVQVDFLDNEELTLIRFLFLELRHYVEKLTDKDDVEKTLRKALEKTSPIYDKEKGIVFPTPITPSGSQVLEMHFTPQEKVCVNVPNSELDEKQELPPMTPEQFDEFCEEMENQNENH